jgi:uncharacterized protein (TIGR02246 family)
MRAGTGAQASAAEGAARELYAEILQRWNAGDAAGFSRAFSRSGSIVGFDGTQVNGQDNIEAHLARVFSSHATAVYVGKVREVRLLGEQVVLLRAVAGMVPPGKSTLNPAVNTIHSLVAASEGGRYRVELFQSTPAAFHGRPEDSERLTTELQEEFDRQQSSLPSV